MILSAMSLAFRLPALVGGWAALAIAVLGAAVAAVLVWRAATKGRSTAAVDYLLANSDGDGASDGLEILAGTDPYDGANYCFNASARFEEVYDTNGVITSEVLWGTNSLVRPFALTNRNETVDLGHLVASNRERLTVRCWDSYRTNTEYEVRHGHEYCMTNRLVLSRFDGDSDGIPDYWEVAHDLSPTNSHDALEDNDHDGLINLHEYWYDLEPFVAAGSNTLISICCRSIDDRIANVTPSNSVRKFSNYHANGINGVFVTNVNFWARDIDLSCASVWNNEDRNGTKTATAITRKHVVLANHWYGNDYYFYCATGTVRRTVVNSYWIDGDLRIGRLNADLPDSFEPAMVLPSNYEEYLGSGRYVPAIAYNQYKEASIVEMLTLNVDLENQDGSVAFGAMGQHDRTNSVGRVRNEFRKYAQVGNSGSPVFVVNGDRPVLLFEKHKGSLSEWTWYYGWGPMVSKRIQTIQNRINEWDGPGNYLLNVVDVSGLLKVKGR